MQLRSYIAPSAPATRAPCDGTEPSIRVEFGFTPRWYRDHCGIDFSARWHEDPLYRAETVETMRRELERRFPDLGFRARFEKRPAGNLDGVHGALAVARLFGIPAEYYADNWPAAKREFLPEAEIARLEPADFDNNAFFQGLLSQMKTLEDAFGVAEGYLNWQGVLNNAFRIRGETVLSDMMANPGLARHLFEVIAETMIEGMRRVYARQRANGFEVRHATVSNCVVNMVSPEQYREFLLPQDRRISEAFEGFGVHNCAWNVDPYIADYASIGKLGYIDMGLDSDLAQAKRLCPGTRRALMYKPTDLEGKTLEELRTDLERVARELSPCDIVMADIDSTTPDERVRAFANIARELE